MPNLWTIILGVWLGTVLAGLTLEFIYDLIHPEDPEGPQ